MAFVFGDSFLGFQKQFGIRTGERQIPFGGGGHFLNPHCYEFEAEGETNETNNIILNPHCYEFEAEADPFEELWNEFEAEGEANDKQPETNNINMLCHFGGGHFLNPHCYATLLLLLLISFFVFYTMVLFVD